MRQFLTSVLFAAALTPASAENAAEGEAIYQRHCATCHGLDAQGDGPMAPALILQPPDLTRLAVRNGGDFPLLRVIQRIDGRDPLVSHGSPMPVYGDFFEGRGAALKTETGQPIMTSDAIVDLVAWLRAIQL